MTAAVQSTDTCVIAQAMARLRQWAESSLLSAPLSVLTAKFCERLVAAGFQSMGYSESNVRYLESVSCLEAFTKRRFRHPESSIPFEVRVDVVVHARPASFGRVAVELRLADVGAGLTGVVGVLHGKSFADSAWAAPQSAFETVQAWEGHVLGHLECFLRELDTPLYDLAMQRVEACASA
jgi:hypothetical protein